MEMRSFLLCLAVVTATAVKGCPTGREFITAFLKNYQYGKASPTLSITAQNSPATVKVEVKGLGYSEKVNIARGETKWITLPANTELEGDGVYRKTVSVSSDADIAVVSSNIKEYTGDSSVIYPINQLGKSYVVFTPSTGAPSFKKEVAIINGNEMNTVNIVFNSPRMKSKTITLNPYEVYQLQSLDNLSGTKITSTLPVAVLAGHECALIVGTCEHVYEQLIPVEFLSNTYLVPPMHHVHSRDTAFVVAPEDNTVVSIFKHNLPKIIKMQSGDVYEVDVDKKAKIIQSTKNIMVMYFSGNIPYDEYLTNVIPVSEMSNSWTIYPQNGYDNNAVIVAEAAAERTFSKSLKWKPFPGDDTYIWTIMPVGSQKGPITISGDSLMAVYIYGGKVRWGYGTTGVCNTGSRSIPAPPPDPCDAIKCRDREECRKGVCVPTSSATCHAVGDPHFRTFDGKRFDFQGTCTYVMVNNTKPQKGLTPFTILVKNNHRGSNRVAYIRVVSVLVYNHTLVASSQRGVIQFDGENTYLPLTIEGGKIKVEQRGWDVIISTDFGLQVKYDWNMMLYITAPSSYSQTVGGLCGNYNGDRRDEYSDPKGTVVSSVLEFAKSWKFPDKDLFCSDDCVGQCPSCSLILQEQYRQESSCGVMAKKDGPFAGCHATVEPNIYVDNCVYDVCINNGAGIFLCNNIQSYVGACMSAGVKITGNWRTISNCPMDCPANSHYEPCGTACAASCADRDATNKCTLPCVEGCQCNAGYVRSGDDCVPLKKCGCTYKDRYYPAEQTFWGDAKCREKCVCNSQTGKVDCTATNCKKSEGCDTRNGVRDCYPLSFGTCQGVGDPHYHTFDGKAFDFQGTCTYYFSKLLNTADPSLTPFEVLVKNENRGSNKAVSFTKTVSISVYGYTIVLSKESPNKVKVNDLYVNLPYQKDGRINIFNTGYFGVVNTDFGLTLKFNWQNHVVLILPSTYASEVGGLCGNWNGNQNDDFRTPDNTLAANPTLFGTSWKIKDDPGCSDECKGKVCPKCDATERSKVTFTKPCSIITDKMGPFKDCHDKVNFNQFYENCVYDMCMYGGHSSALCSILNAYTAACQSALGKVEPWRTNSFCPASCKENSHYEVCGAGCPQTCLGLTEPKGCNGTLCVEGCACDNGFVLSNGECVSMAQCGCTHMGLYYQLGQEFFPEGKCNQRCICKNGQVQCEDGFTCRPDEKCQVQNGVQGCFPESKAVCSVSGYGLYQTFDEKSFSVEGDCEYRLVGTTQTDKKIKSFTVLVKRLSSSEDIVVTRRVKIQIEEYTITLLPGHIWEVQMDDAKTYLPVTVNDGLIQVYQSGLYIVVETNFGLKLTYDTVSMATVEIPSTFKSAVTGLCGNYNGNKADDLVMPNGVQTSSVVYFAESWVSPSDRMMCQTGCGSKCANPDKDTQTQAEKACSILTSDKGPFSNCYDKVSPQKFFDECVKDAAAQPKDNTLLCRHIQRYVASCQETGTSINSWRNDTFCTPKCFEKSHYELCADTCSSTCASLTDSQKCPPCHEGCQCNDGLVFDGGECKALKDCGCSVDGKHYKTGETVVLEDCEEKCLCNAGEFSCEPFQCEENEVCGAKDGTNECYKTDTYCPANSYYDPCGTACPAICADRDAPNNCTLPCVEGCQCQEGYVLSGDDCVPVKKCGCTYKDRYYSAQQIFWGDTKCTEKCVCNSQSGKVECTPAKCKSSEVCSTRNGMKDCYPLSFGTCQGVGDPHYHTFDGKAFDFQGTCTYYFSKLLNTADPSLTPFEVLVKNENRGSNKAVSFTKTVSISVYGYTIVLSKESPNKVKVNDLYVNLPYQKDGRINIFNTGYFGVVNTDFGLTLKFNWQNHVVLILPSTYVSEVGGLCGNWNGIQNDDFYTPNNTLAANPTLFGTSWKVKDDPGCSDECKGKVCPKCDATERSKVTFTKPCSIITDKMGPFKGCHDKVNFNQFYEDCVYDMCMYGGHSSALCSILNAYTAACQSALGKVEPWRTNSFCPASCKENSHYEVCGAGCPQTCLGLTEPKGCNGTFCVEGCACDNGFVLSNGECVSKPQCGCTHMGLYYQLGQEFFPEGKCNQRCVCKENRQVQCEDRFTCRPDEKCQVQNGVQGCFPESKAVCSVSGNGLYQSFDGKSFSVEGDCEYRLAETRTKDEKIKNSFSVLMKQLSSSEDVPITRRVTLQVDQYIITLMPGHNWEVQVDNIKRNLPVTVNEGLIKVYQSGLYIVVETNFGLKLTYDTVSMATVEIPSTFKNAVTGLCGNYNGNNVDDLLMPDGIQTSSVVYFAESWVSPSDRMMCQTGCGSKCANPDKDTQTQAEKACSILTSDKGPFSNCYDKVSPQKFFDECVKDVAAQPKDNTLLCRHVQRYVASCQETGTSINSWRNDTFCTPQCFENSHYELCADTCSSTCASLTNSQTCPLCQEGCQCDDGFVFDGGECKALKDCGCYVDGKYYKSGEVVVLGDCKGKCSCNTGMFSCETLKCASDQVCGEKDGVVGCYNKDPCSDHKCREKEYCTVTDNKALCVAKSKVSCMATGDPHYRTFDGNHFSFQGICSYTLVKTSGKDQTLTPFSIVNKNDMQKSSYGSYVKSASIKVKGHDITFYKDNRNHVTIDGKVLKLPVSLNSEGIEIVLTGTKGIMQTDFGLEVIFNWADTLLVILSSSYYNNIEGMCGTYSDDLSDDFVTPSGSIITDVTEWAKSWSVPETSGNCWHFPPCSDEKKSLYRGKSYCGLIEDANGPFNQCQNIISKRQFASDCLFQLCLRDGSQDAFCHSLNNYASVCALAKADVSPNWKQLANCCVNACQRLLITNTSLTTELQGDVLLPCLFNSELLQSKRTEETSVVWSQLNTTQTEIVEIGLNGETKFWNYRGGRIKAFPKLESRLLEFSIVIRNVQQSDLGFYHCKLFRETGCLLAYVNIELNKSKLSAVVSENTLFWLIPTGATGGGVVLLVLLIITFKLLKRQKMHSEPVYENTSESSKTKSINERSIDKNIGTEPVYVNTPESKTRSISKENFKNQQTFQGTNDNPLYSSTSTTRGL